MFKARAFYSIIYADGGKWNDDSTCAIGFRGSGEFGRKVQGGSHLGAGQVQQYNLYPNPNNGNITLQQKVADANPINLEVLNAEGQSVLKKQLLFMQGLYPLSLQNLSPGLYLIQLRDAAGKSYTLKFIVNSQ